MQQPDNRLERLPALRTLFGVILVGNPAWEGMPLYTIWITGTL